MRRMKHIRLLCMHGGIALVHDLLLLAGHKSVMMLEVIQLLVIQAVEVFSGEICFDLLVWSAENDDFGAKNSKLHKKEFEQLLSPQMHVVSEVPPSKEGNSQHNVAGDLAGSDVELGGLKLLLLLSCKEMMRMLSQNLLFQLVSLFDCQEKWRLGVELRGRSCVLRNWCCGGRCWLMGCLWLLRIARV